MHEELGDIKLLDLLEATRKTLNGMMQTAPFKTSPNFEKIVREVISRELEKVGSTIKVDFDSHVQAFPDICLGKYGIEVKYTEKDTWRGVANSVSQGMLNPNVKEIYVIWCKEGGQEPEIRYRPYEDVVMHVRTSHVPRFEIDMETNQSLFRRFKTTYSEFTTFKMEEKMDLVRAYARKRIGHGSNTFFWFLESQIVDPVNRRTLRLFQELESRKQLAAAIEEVLLFTDAFLMDPQGNLFFDIRVNHFYNKHRFVYPQSLSLFSAIASKKENGEPVDVIKSLLNHIDKTRDIFEEIDENSFRIYADWWDGILPLSFDTWMDYIKKVI